MLRIACVPSAHPYVASVVPPLLQVPYEAVPDTLGVAVHMPRARAARLPDPLPDGGPARPGVWWPARALDPAWVEEHASLIDVVHLHFGFESRTVEQLGEWVDALDRKGIPLVHTVHDLQNPHLTDQSDHDAAVGLLVRRAAAVLTLTPGAAAEVERRWGVRPTVVPHPQIVPDEGIVDTRREGPLRLGMHLGALRAGTDPTPWLARMADAAEGAGARLTIHVNDEVLAADDPRRVGLLARIREVVEQSPAAELEPLPRLDDDELHAWVGGLDLAVLPYHHGTHSGWLEMCWDLGTPVLTPPVGHLAEQHPDPSFVRTFDPDAGPAADDVLALAQRRPCPWGDADARRAERRRQAAAVREAHTDVYEGVVRAGRRD